MFALTTIELEFLLLSLPTAVTIATFMLILRRKQLEQRTRQPARIPVEARDRAAGR